MSQLNDKTIIYIAGDGHSGSTLLDIVLGNHQNAFSTGELSFLPQKGIANQEYCACGKKVPKCEVWSKVIRRWNEKRKLPLDRYIQLQNKLTSNKNIFFAIQQSRNPTGEISNFIHDTSLLYNHIFKVTNANIIIDSSKSPNRILILKKLGYNLIVVHLTRRFGDVLNSNKKRLKKNLKAGIEEEIFPRKTSYILNGWILKNFLVKTYSREIEFYKVKYEFFIQNPVKVITNIMNNIDPLYSKKLKARGPFSPKHLVAGNKIRMKKEIYIANKPMDNSYHRLNKSNRFLSHIIDSFY